MRSFYDLFWRDCDIHVLFLDCTKLSHLFWTLFYFVVIMLYFVVIMRYLHVHVLLVVHQKGQADSSYVTYFSLIAPNCPSCPIIVPGVPILRWLHTLLQLIMRWHRSHKDEMFLTRRLARYVPCDYYMAWLRGHWYPLIATHTHSVFSQSATSQELFLKQLNEEASYQLPDKNNHWPPGIEIACTLFCALCENDWSGKSIAVLGKSLNK